jgi:hypothetical protein
MHDVCRLLEVPPTRAHVSRTGRGGGRFGGAEEKNARGVALSGSGHTEAYVTGKFEVLLHRRANNWDLRPVSTYGIQHT